MKREQGFTIVELLIVIVVIGILAAITIVAFNGIQTRSNASKTMSELASLNKAIQLYYADEGSYPIANSWSGIGKEANFIPGIAPKYIPSIPQNSMPDKAEPCPGSGAVYRSVYMYRSNATGSEYKLIAHCDSLCDTVRGINSRLVDTLRTGSTCWAYGYWSAGGAAF